MFLLPAKDKKPPVLVHCIKLSPATKGNFPSRFKAFCRLVDSRYESNPTDCHSCMVHSRYESNPTDCHSCIGICLKLDLL